MNICDDFSATRLYVGIKVNFMMSMVKSGEKCTIYDFAFIDERLKFIERKQQQATATTTTVLTIIQKPKKTTTKKHAQFTHT